MNYIEGIKSQMKNIEKKVKDQDTFIKKQSNRLKEAIDKTVSLDDIAQKMEQKMFKFLQKEHSKKYGGFNPDDTMTIFHDMNQQKHSASERFDTMDLSAINVNDSLFGDLNELGENKRSNAELA